MAESQPQEGSSTSGVSGGSSESTVQLNIKTLDSRIYSFHVDKNIVISAFKEKIAAQSGVPVGQQRLIFRGKVLKDDHPLSEYNVESGDTLHLVERQPQPTGSNTGEATSSNGNRAQDPNVGGPRSRIGPIAHSIVLGTLNVADQGEAVVPDLSRVIGAVLNSIGIGNPAGGLQAGVPTPNGNETGGSQANAGGQSQGGNQSVPWQAFHGQSAASMQIPPGAAIAVPSLNMPIPDSLNTLTEFMNRMGQTFSQNGSQQNQSTTASGNPPRIELRTNARGLPTVEALSIVLRHAQRLLSDHAVPALSNVAGRLDQERESNDPAARGQVQTESIQLGMAMQHLGALLLELGRTILTLRMGQSPNESFVNAGPAVYISPSGPNPIMVQPFPLQTSSLFGASSIPVAMGPVGVGGAGAGAGAPRNVNIHIHTGASLAPTGGRVPNGEGVRGVRTESGDSGQAPSAGINFTTTTVQSQPAMVSTPDSVPPGSGVSQDPDSNYISSRVAEVNAQIRRLVAMQSENRAATGQPEGSTSQEQHAGCGPREDNTCRDDTTASEASHAVPDVTMDDQKLQAACDQPHTREMEDVLNSNSVHSIGSGEGSLKRPSVSSEGTDNPDGSAGVPLGLGLGGLHPKRRSRQPRTQAKDGDGASASSQNQQSSVVGQHVLQSLASLTSQRNTNSVPSGQSPELPRGVGGSLPAARQHADDQNDVADAMSQMLQSPSLDGLLSGVSQQTGIGSPDMLRNVLQQFTQNPAMRNTVNQIAQQIDHHDLGSMFSGMDSEPGGGFDLSRMMQQMMPIVSQALGGMSAVSQPTPPSESRSRREMTTSNDDSQIDLRPLVQRLGNQSSPNDIFRSVVDSAVNLYSNGSARENVVNELCSQGELAQEFMEMLSRDVSHRFQDGMGS